MLLVSFIKSSRSRRWDGDFLTWHVLSLCESLDLWQMTEAPSSVHIGKEKIVFESFTISVILSDLWIRRERPTNIRRVKIANSQQRFIYTCDQSSRHLSIFTAASSDREDSSTSCWSYEACWFNWVFFTFALASILLPGKRHHQWTFGQPSSLHKC